jgi:hypothetical protein
MRAIHKVLGCVSLLGLLAQGEFLLAQTLKELKADLLVTPEVAAADEGGEPVLGLFTVLFLGSALVAIAVVVLGLRAAGRQRDRPGSEEITGERDSFFLHIAFLGAGYAAIILMLAYVPPAMTPGLGTATRWTLIVAAVFISLAHLLAAHDERTLPPFLKYLFSGTVVLAAVFFHLAFKRWSFLQFSDPFYSGKGPYVALGLIILVVLGYSAFITGQHFKKTC